MTPDEKSWIAELLDFTYRDGDVFVVAAPPEGPNPRLFGGMIAAQALAAAGATVAPDKLPQSLHLYFVRGGRYGEPVEFSVERTRDGRSFDTRRVTAVQRGAVILEMIASFHVAEPGADEQPAAPPSLALAEARPKVLGLEFVDRFDIRTAPADDTPFPLPPLWIRTHDQIEDDPLVRACMLTFLSDFGPVPAARPSGVTLAHGTSYAASLDHSVWFHRPFVPHDWHLYDVVQRNHSDSRGLVMGSLYDRDGALIASTTQEALWRP
ncbi:acyl-CoA thioesterase II [Mycolicibacterium sp. 018/SC-01/001]|uniref:acyl-CoA thioesterase n=1 Tax=Mycolicibacterium sp. 018/SC-01/001 TaxID=2592069 RepID=UPI001180544B|nr:acyl-CoA thioesterase domain-containing protein [Mycolicibacterium sp. 018/SC-01/001]TRW80708.1 acyl-CoA thioesterase II [Mycolicibacterium sp. 018/SC-01/001]